MPNPEIAILSSEINWLKPTRHSLNCYGLGQFPHVDSANPLLAGNALIDPGTNLNALKASFAAIGKELAAIEHIFLTHLHWDHAAVTRQLRHEILKRGGKVRVFGPTGSKEVAASAKPEMLGTIYYPGSKVNRIWIDEELPPGVEVTAGEVSISGILTPGHTSPHMSFLVVDSDGTRILASGDSVGGLIDSRTLSSPEEYYDHGLATLAIPLIMIHEGHGHPGHLLKPETLQRRMEDTAQKAGDLRPGPFPDTLYPHH